MAAVGFRFQLKKFSFVAFFLYDFPALFFLGSHHQA
jgi:hypothetical protein